MDRKKIEADLRQAEDHIRLGEEHIAKQRRIIEELARDGHPTAMARELLKTFEELQETHIAGRDTIADELAIAEGEERRMAGTRMTDAKSF